MASFVARRAALSLRSSFAGCSRRAIHHTPVVLKKKAAAAEIEDLFSDEVVEDLIPSEAAPQKKPVTQKKASSARVVAKVAPEASTSKASSTVTATPTVSRKLSQKDRAARFDQIIQFVTPRLGRNPTVKMPMVRSSAWVHLVQLATTEQQLEMVTGMFPGWVEAGYKFNNSFSELFVRRCEELNCPLLALKVYGNFAKYNVPLPLPAARQLLHSLHLKHPIESVMTAASLYDVYKLPSVSEDLVSASLVATACFKHKSKHSLTVANVLVPQIQQLLSGYQPWRKKAAEGAEGAEKASRPNPAAFSEKPLAWIKWTLKKIDMATYAQTGRRNRLIRRWRERSGHISVSTQF